jgi:hypothetical protein
MKYVEAAKAIRIKTLIFDVKYKDHSDGQKDAFHDRNARPLGPLRLKATDSETHNSQDEDNNQIRMALSLGPKNASIILSNHLII